MSDVLEPSLSAPPATNDRVAPWLHTLFLLIVLTFWAAYGAMRMRAHVVTSLPRGPLYAGEMMLEYLLVGSTIAGLYHRRQFLLALLGDFKPTNAIADVGQGILVFLGGWAATLVVGILIAPAHLSHNTTTVVAMAPHNAFEMLLWVAVSATAGVCEEFVFRGYLLRQFTRWLGGAVQAIVVSAVLFGCMHFYEGPAAVVQICGLGAFYATMAVRAGHIRHVAIAHFLQDLVAGFSLYWMAGHGR